MTDKQFLLEGCRSKFIIWGDGGQRFWRASIYHNFGKNTIYTPHKLCLWRVYCFHLVRLSVLASVHDVLFLARMFESTGRAIAITKASASSSFKMLKFLVKVFKSLYLLNPWMDLVDTLPDVRYWSEVLCRTIMTHISDLEVKVTDFEILS